MTADLLTLAIKERPLPSRRFDVAAAVIGGRNILETLPLGTAAATTHE